MESILFACATHFQGKTALAEVFVDLQVTNDANQAPPDDRENDKHPLPAFIHDILETGNCRLDPRTLEESKKTGGDAGPQSEIERGRVVLVGGPAQGHYQRDLPGLSGRILHGR